ncbi:AAA family ATPase [Halococcus agarilyticus]|uniref:AAA family ATPase n=1 Tax=Halococcus agarilyticus TaxID=1232219 RepID=UPI000677A721|nr:AAA family ATPase [Halococcus agarilyticus]
MFHFCPACSGTPRDVAIDHDAGTVTCPVCGDTRRYEAAPLFVVTGAPGVGKTTIYREIVGTVPAVVVEPDLYWLEGTGEIREAWRVLPEEARRAFHLLQYAELARSGRPVVAFGAALGDPEVVEELPEADYFPRIEYLALVCDPDDQARRLRGRDGWAEAAAADEEWADVEAGRRMNERFRRFAAEHDDYEAIDTTDATVPETIEAVRGWLRERTTSG